MKAKRLFFMFLIALVSVMAGVAKAQTPQYKYHKFNSTDGGIYDKVSPDGKWALVNVNLGMSAGVEVSPSKIVNTATGEMFPVYYNNRILDIRDISSEGGDGRVTIVGSFYDRPMSYCFDPKNPDYQGQGTMTIYNLADHWKKGSLESITPDGRYAVGYQTSYNSGGDVEEYYFTTIFVEVGNSNPIATPGAPKYDRNGIDQNFIRFNDISADGRYILGEREWFYNGDGFPFVYDTQTDTYKAIGFTTEGNRQIPQQNIEKLEYLVMSPSGRYVGALAWTTSEDDSGNTDNYPSRYDVQTGELTIFKESESANVSVGCIDDSGTIFGLPDTGSPIRNFKIFYNDKHWISFSEICRQIYSFDFYQRLGYYNTGTPTSVTADGTAFVSYSDPICESYYFNLGTTIENVCSGIDLLNDYTITPERGSNVSTFNSVEISFDRAVQVVGRGDTHFHLYKKGKDGVADTKVCDGLSSMGENGGLFLKSNSSKTVVATVQDVELEVDVEYYFVLDAGAVAVASDITITNRQPIKATYHNHRHTFSTADDVCDKCGHGFLRYEANDVVGLSYPDAFTDSEGEVAEILNNTFDNGHGVMEFDRPLVRIAPFAFYNSGFTAVTLGNSVASISEDAFFYCQDLNNVMMHSIPAVGSNAFDEITDNKYLNLSDNSYVCTEDNPNFPQVTTASYTRTMSNEWGTVVVPFNVAPSTDDYTLYAISSVTNDQLELTKCEEEVPAGTPVLVRMKAPAMTSFGKYELNLTAENVSVDATGSLTSTTVDGLTLTGTYTVRDITSENGYIISNNKFWSIQDVKGTNSVYNAPFRAYIASDGPARAKQMSLSMDNYGVTSVEALNAITSGKAEYYDLSGNRITQIRQGINIVKLPSGKTQKVLIK